MLENTTPDIWGFECEYDLDQDGVCFVGIDAASRYVEERWDEETMGSIEQAEEDDLLTYFSYIVKA